MKSIDHSPAHILVPFPRPHTFNCCPGDLRIQGKISSGLSCSSEMKWGNSWIWHQKIWDQNSLFSIHDWVHMESSHYLLEPSLSNQSHRGTNSFSVFTVSQGCPLDQLKYYEIIQYSGKHKANISNIYYIFSSCYFV